MGTRDCRTIALKDGRTTFSLKAVPFVALPFFYNLVPLVMHKKSPANAGLFTVSKIKN